MVSKADEAGCDEAVFHRGDIVTEASHSNVHIIKDGVFKTHPTDNYILPGISSPFYIYMFRNAFAAIPDSITEAAELDGASNLRIFWNILLPMTLPTVATVGTLSFIGSWNDYVWPLMVLTNTDQFPLQVAITNINSTNPVYMNQVMAILTISTVPLVLVYIFFQKYLTQGMGSAGNGDK